MYHQYFVHLENSDTNRTQCLSYAQYVMTREHYWMQIALDETTIYYVG